MKEKDAVIIIQLSQLGIDQKTAYAIAGKQGTTYLSAHQNLKILESQGYVKNVKSQGRSIWLPTESGIAEAKSVLSQENSNKIKGH